MANREDSEYIFFRKNGRLQKFPRKDKTTLFRGLTQKYDPEYDKSKFRMFFLKRY